MGRTVVISGGGTGIGFAAAETFAADRELAADAGLDGVDDALLAAVRRDAQKRASRAHFGTGN